MRIEGNRFEFDGQVMKKNIQPVDYMPNKYGQKVRPYEIQVKVKQSESSRIEYFYSLKSFEKETVVSERDPHRVLQI